MTRHACAGPTARRAIARGALAIAAVSLLAWACAGPAPQGGPAREDVEAFTRAAHRANAYRDLEELTRAIGPRLTGSPNERRAVAWAMAKMRAYGLENVHEEPWRLARGWERGHASGEMVVPRRVPLQLSAYGWTGSTRDGGIVADLVACDPSDGGERLAERAARWKGKIVIVAGHDASRSDRLAAFVDFGALVRAAEEAGAVGLIRHDPRPGPLLHAEPVDFRGEAFSIPVLDIGESQQAMLEGLLRHGERVSIRLDVRNRVSDGPVTSSNVVGEIRGRERPGRVVLIGAHIDSWDLATGAIDDGFGTAAVLAAARVLVESGRAPRRTIRFVLFTGEEQGLLGSRAYVRAHRGEMAALACAFALDWGGGPIAAIPLAGHAEMRGVFQRAANDLRSAQPIRVLDGYLGYTDAYAFSLAGVPGIGLYQDSPGYDAIGHSRADTLDKVDPRMLDRDVAALAMLALEVADGPQRIGTVWDARTTARTLVRDHQDAALRGLGMWPF